MSDKLILIGLTGLAGAGKDSAADALVLRAGFHKLAFADALRFEVEQAYELLADDRLLRDRATKETPTDRLALGWCTNIEFVQAVNRSVFSGDMPLSELDVPRSPRQILQWWGTEYRRAQHEDYWVRQMALQIVTARSNAGLRRVVVTDCRFANEAALIRAQGGELWQVFRPGLAVVEGGHASQTSGDALRPERILVNNGTLDALAAQALRLLTKRHGGAVLPIEIDGVTR